MAVLFFLSIFSLAAGYAKKDLLPPLSQVDQRLYQEPLQTKTSTESFEREIGDIVYTIKPLYDYELYGMVVTYHDSNAWWDIYHHGIWNDFINVKDICVVWGNNLSSGVYQELEFWSDPWTCYMQSNDWSTYHKYRNENLSNNHLLSESSRLNSEIMSAKKGDQIYLRGYLAQYSHSDGKFTRGSSTKRTDKGNGACETVYLEDFQIIKAANPYWRFLYSWSWLTLIIGFLGWFFLD